MSSVLLTVPQTADYLNLPVSKVYELAHAKDFPAVKLGKSWRIHAGRLDQWLEKKLDKKD